VVQRQESILHRIDGVLLVAGETARDPRLDALDVRSGERAVTIEVVADDQKPVWGAEVVASRDRARIAAALTGRDGKARLVAPQFPVDLLVYDPGSGGEGAFRAVSVRGIDRDQHIVVPAGLRVRIRVLGEPQIPEGLTLLPELFLKGGTAPDGHTPVGDLFPQFGTVMGYGPQRPGAAFHVPLAAAYTVRFGLKSTSNQVVPLDDRQDIVVADQAEEQVFEVRPSAAGIARAAEILRRQDR
jgi:hypothetical protein